MQKRLFPAILLSVAVLLAVVHTATAQQAATPDRTHIFFSAGCADCWLYEVQTFSIDTPFVEALSQTLTAAGPLPVGLANLGQLLPAVIVTGLVDDE